MKFLLDTDICIYIVRRKPPEVLERFRQHKVGEIGISSITYSELLFGAENSSRAERNRLALDHFVAPLEICPYPPEAAADYGRIRAHLKESGQLIRALDMLIAAHCWYLGTILVTNNVNDFGRVPNLAIENWAAD